MNGKRILLGILFLVFARTASAECVRMNLSSCWDLVNRSHQEVELSCRDEGADLFGKRSLPAGAVYEQQFPTDLNNGRGAFGPDVRIRCQIKARSGSTTNIRFPLLGSGDRVAITVNDNNVMVIVRSYWTRGVFQKYRFQRS